MKCLRISRDIAGITFALSPAALVASTALGAAKVIGFDETMGLLAIVTVAGCASGAVMSVCHSITKTTPPEGSAADGR